MLEKRFEYRGEVLRLEVRPSADFMEIMTYYCSIPSYLRFITITSVCGLERCINEIESDFKINVDKIIQEANVRRTILKIKESLHNELQKFYFEINDSELRKEMTKRCVNTLENFLDMDLISRYSIDRKSDDKNVIDIMIVPKNVIKSITIEIKNI